MEQCICESDPINSPDLTTIEAMLLAVFWIAGPTVPNNVSSIDEDDGDNDKEQVTEEKNPLAQVCYFFFPFYRFFVQFGQVHILYSFCGNVKVWAKGRGRCVLSYCLTLDDDDKGDDDGCGSI